MKRTKEEIETETQMVLGAAMEFAAKNSDTFAPGNLEEILGMSRAKLSGIVQRLKKQGKVARISSQFWRIV